VRSLLTMEEAVRAVEEAFAAHGRGAALMPPKVYLSLDEHGGDFRAMPAYMEGAAGLKWVNSHPDNPGRHGLPSVMGMYILSDAATAVPLAVMDATALTAFRTGAAAAVASRFLARPEPASIGFVGCGVQARVLIDAHRVVYRDRFDRIELAMADVDQAAAEALAREAGGSAVSVEEAAGCDIVCTATPGRAPVIRRAWIRAGAHINAMGADAPGKRELDPDILAAATIVIDDHHQATTSGEINIAYGKGELTDADIHATLGEVVIGKAPGRAGDEITVFDSTGLAIQDLALARRLHDLACSRNVGQRIDFVGTSRS
jgi:alanine dehydrogenase